ncbi:penicillin-binding transpeptidase domain-containing protein [Haliangium sp.]|uniref:penicillin-binding transpeptidase domain-containing protein n=1 Tax=Haliangium sp. TaxID=2663208 RepID=UPI003D0BA09B
MPTTTRPSWLLCAALLLAVTSSAHADPAPAPSGAPAPDASAVLERWRALMGGRAGCFAVHHPASGRTWRSDDVACGERRPPFSTFKIPHSLLALDSGTLASADVVIPWDRKRYPAQRWWPKAWRGRHDLRSAFRHSVVPYYRTLAGRVGVATMQRYLDAFDYGNRALGPALDSFWLGGELAISADEQLAFLTKLQAGTLPVKAAAAETVRDIMVIERASDYVLRGKTGTGDVGEGRYLGWLVGWVERGGEVFVFALALEGKSFAEVRDPRRGLVDAMLAELGVEAPVASGTPARGRAEP